MHGYASAEPLCFKRVLNSNSHEAAALYYIDAREVDLTAAVNAPLPPTPLETSILPHRLAIEGVQPAIPAQPTPPESTPAACLEEIMKQLLT